LFTGDYILIPLCHLVYRTNTFPLVHAGFFHTLMNILALTPLLERFEAEYGTLTTLALFMGRKSSFAAVGPWGVCGIVTDLHLSSVDNPSSGIYIY
jgi:hypothetical protein